MKVSLRATYGIMAAVDLAMHIGTAPVQAKSIAHRQAIPARFLEQVLHGMKKAGLVSSLRGAQGGYVLSRKPSEVSIVEILEALDGPLSPLNGGASRAQGRRLGKPELLLGKIWEQVHQAERHVLEAISVEELAGQQRVIEQERTLMYHI
jgi:Rrf2 family transcriptional regulator, cysteine metabolism repressor